jgi:hypothetical protein
MAAVMAGAIAVAEVIIIIMVGAEAIIIVGEHHRHWC